MNFYPFNMHAYDILPESHKAEIARVIAGGGNNPGNRIDTTGTKPFIENDKKNVGKAKKPESRTGQVEMF